MNIRAKTGMVLALLAVPVFIWFLFERFARNQYTIPVFYEEGVGQTVCGSDTLAPHTLPPFSLQQTTQPQAFDETALNDRLSVFYLFDYPCDSSCNLVMEELARVQNVFEEQPILQILAIDRTHAAEESLVALSKNYYNRPERWKFLSGPAADVVNLSQCGLMLEKQPDIQHPLVLVDGQRKIRGYYTGTDAEEVDRLIVEIRILLYTRQQDHV